MSSQSQSCRRLAHLFYYYHGIEGVPHAQNTELAYKFCKLAIGQGIETLSRTSRQDQGRRAGGAHEPDVRAVPRRVLVGAPRVAARALKHARARVPGAARECQAEKRSVFASMERVR